MGSIVNLLKIKMNMHELYMNMHFALYREHCAFSLEVRSMLVVWRKVGCLL